MKSEKFLLFTIAKTDNVPYIISVFKNHNQNKHISGGFKSA